MKPFHFFKLVFFYTKERENKKLYPYYLGLAKRVVDHLTRIGWTESDIRMVIPMMINSLIMQGTPPTYGIVGGILLNTSLKPIDESISEDVDPKYRAWIEAEIERLRNETKQ